jgi:hypothetical protein
MDPQSRALSLEAADSFYRQFDRIVDADYGDSVIERRGPRQMADRMLQEFLRA